MTTAGIQTILFTVLSADPLRQPFVRAEAATEAGVESDDMFMWLFWFSTVWFVGLMTLMFWWVVKYRRRAGTIAPYSASHNTPLEIAWTIIPTLFLVWIFFKGFSGYLSKIVAPGDSLVMDVTAKKWSWTVKYPGGAMSTETVVLGSTPVPVFYMPAERGVQFRMNSDDVMHAFWVPDFRVKQDVLPNRFTTLWFRVAKPDGTHRFPVVEPDSLDAKNAVKSALSGQAYSDHWLFCAEYCGDMHSEMAAVIRVVDDAVFNRWLSAAGVGSMEPLALGEYTYKTQCATCHTTNGLPGTGPTWKDLYGKTETLTDGSTVLVCDDYIRESIVTPQAKIVKGFENSVMTPFGQLPREQIDGLIAYMRTLSATGGENTPCPQPAESK